MSQSRLVVTDEVVVLSIDYLYWIAVSFAVTEREMVFFSQILQVPIPSYVLSPLNLLISPSDHKFLKSNLVF